MTVNNLSQAGLMAASRTKRVKYQKLDTHASDEDDIELEDRQGNAPEEASTGIHLEPSSGVSNVNSSVPPVLEVEDVLSGKEEEAAEHQNLPATTPRRVYCSFCERTVLTTVELQATTCSFFIGFLTFLFCGWLSLCLLPFLWPLLQTAVHRCPVCQDKLTSYSRVSCFKFREQIVTFRIGTCALVLSRRYIIALLTMLSLVLAGLSIRWYLEAIDFPDSIRGELLETPWTEFLQDCGGKSYLGNPLRAESLFEEKYAERTVRWEGRMHHVQEGFFSKNFVYIDMDPPYYPRNDYRDLLLIFGKSLLPDVAHLEVGDQLIFETTLLELGRRGRPHVGVLWGFNVTVKADKLPVMDKGLRNPLLLFQETIRSSPLRLDKVVEGIREVPSFRIVMYQPAEQERTVQVVTPGDDQSFQDKADETTVASP